MTSAHHVEAQSPSQSLLRSDSGPVAWLTLNRPQAMNALNSDVLEMLDAHLADIESDDRIHNVVVTGAGRAFCAGADLKELVGPDDAVDPGRMLAFERRAMKVFARLAALPKPVIIAANGIAMAGGLELAMHGDIVLADDRARFGDGHINYGLVPGAGGAVRLARIVGPGRAKYLAFTGRLLPAAECLAMGLVHEVVEAGRLRERAQALGEEMAGRSRSAIRLFKQAIDDGLEQPLSTAHRMEHLIAAEHLHTNDVNEGLNAFREKRTPRFGRGD